MALRIFMCLLVLSVPVVLVGCGGETSEESETVTEPLYSEPKTGDTTGMPADYEKEMMPQSGQPKSEQP